MSRIISQLILAMLMPPGVALIYTIAFILFEDQFRLNESASVFYAGTICVPLLMLWWILIWRSHIRWNRRRVALTMTLTIGVVGASACLAWILGNLIAEHFGFFIWAPVIGVAWPIGTTLIWRESGAELSARLSENGPDGSASVPCPVCHYDLTGQREARCPECGTEFTIGRLVAASHGRSADSISAHA